MNKLLSAAFLLALVACNDAVPSTEPGGDLDVSGFDLLDVSSTELATSLVESDEGIVALSELGADGAKVYLDPSTLQLDGSPEEADDNPAAQARALAPQCWQQWYYPGQQVQGTVWVCIPREGGGQWCFPRTVWLTVTVTCNNRLSCSIAPPNGTQCKYILNGQAYSVPEPFSSPSCGLHGGLCPGSGGDPSNCEEPIDPC